MGRIVVNKFILNEFLHFKHLELKLNSINLFTGDNHHILNVFNIMNDINVDNYNEFEDSRISFTLEFKDNFSLDYEYYIDNGQIFNINEEGNKCAIYSHARKKRSKYYIVPEFQVLDLRKNLNFQFDECNKDEALFPDGKNFLSFFEYLKNSNELDLYFENILKAYIDIYTNVKDIVVTKKGIVFLDENGEETRKNNLLFLFLLTAIFIPSYYTWDVVLLNYPELKLNEKELIKIYNSLLNYADNQVIISSNSKCLIERCRRDRIYISSGGQVEPYIEEQ